MRNARLVDRWIRKGEDDLVVARRAITGRRKIVWASCFHAQQGAEKFLKAYLIHIGVRPIRTHDLVRLLHQCENHDSEFGFLTDLCHYLIPFGVDVRYPEELELKLKDAKKALRAASEILLFISRKLGSGLV